MIQIIQQHVSNLMEAVSWHARVWLPMERDHGCSLMMWLLTKAAICFLMCTELYSLLTFSQMLQSCMDDASQCWWDNDPTNAAKATQDFLKVNKWDILQQPSLSLDLHLIKHTFLLLKKKKTKGRRHENKQPLKVAAVKEWQSISTEETRLQNVIDSKGFSSKD